MIKGVNPLNAKFTKWSNTLKQFVGKLPTNCLSVFDYFVGLAFKGVHTGRFLSLVARNSGVAEETHILEKCAGRNTNSLVGIQKDWIDSYE